MIPLGRVVRLQVQTSSLKVGSGAKQRYDRRPIESLPYLELNDGGVVGIGRFGQRLGDVHHRDHPDSKLRGAENAISFGFTGHYASIREQFGPHVVDGAAGENILIEHHGRVTAGELAGGVFIETIDGGAAHVEQIIIAEPCAPFSRWVLEFPDNARPDRRVTEALQFLSGGIRGFYCRYTGSPVRIALNATVYLTDTSGSPPPCALHCPSGSGVPNRTGPGRVHGVRGRPFERT